MPINPTSHHIVYTPILPALAIDPSTGTRTRLRTQNRRRSGRNTETSDPIRQLWSNRDTSPSPSHHALPNGHLESEFRFPKQIQKISCLIPDISVQEDIAPDSGTSPSDSLFNSLPTPELVHQHSKLAQARSLVLAIQARLESEEKTETETEGEAMSNGYPPAGSSGPGAGGPGQGPWGGPFPTLHLWPLHDTFQMKMIHLPVGERVSVGICILSMPFPASYSPTPSIASFTSKLLPVLIWCRQF